MMCTFVGWTRSTTTVGLSSVLNNEALVRV